MPTRISEMNAYRLASALRTMLQARLAQQSRHRDASPHISMDQGQLTPWSTLHVKLFRVPTRADRLEIAAKLKDNRHFDILRIDSPFGSFTGDAAKAAQYFKALAQATEPKPG